MTMKFYQKIERPDLHIGAVRQASPGQRKFGWFASSLRRGIGLMLCLCAVWMGLSSCTASHTADSDQELARAKKLIADGNFSEAFLQLNKALVEAPRDPQVHLNLGWLYLYTDNPVAAERELNAANQLAPDLADTYKLRGDLLSYKGSHSKTPAEAQRDQAAAVENFQQALQRDAKNYQTYYDMATSLSQINKNEEALAKLDEGFDHIPKRDLETQVNFQIASCSAEAKLKLYDDAIADCQQAYEFTNSPASRERIEAMIENMKLLNPNGASSLSPQEAPPSGSKAAREAEENAIINEAASD
jgi:tetratricopeptide (TPR) repeat protein